MERDVTIHLWLYRLWMADDILNCTPNKGSDLSPVEIFTGVGAQLKLQHFHTFGCPTFMLDNKLQSQQIFPKWQMQSRVVIYLGPSPSHSRSISLVLNPTMGHVWPQFHVRHNDFFKIMSDNTTNFKSPTPKRMKLSGLASSKQPIF